MNDTIAALRLEYQAQRDAMDEAEGNPPPRGKLRPALDWSAMDR